jgi:hypothetical protein
MRLNKRARLFAGWLLVAILSALLAACGDAPTNTSAPATTAAQTQAATTAATSVTTAAPSATTAASATTTAAASSNWSLATAAQPYKGKKVTMATVAWKDATVELAKEFTAQSGIELEVIQLPNAELLQKTLLDARTKTGAYDIIAFSPTTPFAKPGFVIPLDEYLTGPLADPTYNLKDNVNADFYTKYNGKTVSLVGINAVLSQRLVRQRAISDRV